MNKKHLIHIGSAAFLSLGLFFTACANREESILPSSDDKIGPYINISQYEFYTETGTPIDFSNIGGYDDVDGLLPTRLRGYVDYNTPGDYYPSLVCTDLSNNESEVIITIHVVEVGSLPSAATAETPEPTPSTCEKGTDPDQPCSVVLPSTVSVYRTLYAGEEGKELCEAANGEDACEVIPRNDGSLWGYGVK